MTFILRVTSKCKHSGSKSIFKLCYFKGRSNKKQNTPFLHESLWLGVKGTTKPQTISSEGNKLIEPSRFDSPKKIYFTQFELMPPELQLKKLKCVQMCQYNVGRFLWNSISSYWFAFLSGQTGFLSGQNWPLAWQMTCLWAKIICRLVYCICKTLQAFTSIYIVTSVYLLWCIGGGVFFSN